VRPTLRPFPPTTDHAWAGRARASLQIGVSSFGVLALELALIRWTSGQIRLFAYFNNVVLITAFLGVGLGLALGRRRPGLVHWALPALALVSAVVGLSDRIGIVHLVFPDPAIHLWGAEMRLAGNAALLVQNVVLFLGLLGCVGLVFLTAAAPLGWLFSASPPLRAYRWNLTGSLLGVLAMTALSAGGLAPPFWLAAGVLPFAWLSRTPASLASGALAIALGAASVGGAVFSPYNRIDVRAAGASTRLDVNRDFHQFMHDLSSPSVAIEPAETGADFRTLRDAYDLPFVVNDRRGSALVVGAGAGNDAQAALRAGYSRVTSVDIDGKILELGRRLHPERPYDDPRVELVVDDARAFFRRERGRSWDAVVFGLLDSHAMFASLSSLRLDNYVYTEEGIRDAWRLVSPRGHLSVSFSAFGGPWIGDRLFWTIARATGRLPAVFPTGMHHARTYLVPGPEARLALGRVPFPRAEPSAPEAAAVTTSDDWPFLYLRPGAFPWGYAVVLGAILLAAGACVPLAFGRQAVGSAFDPVLFLMGAGFLLVETRGVTALSLLFGSTWIVNAAVFAGVLAMALFANEAVVRLGPKRYEPWGAALLGSVLLLWLCPPSLLSPLPPVPRGLLGGLLNGLPVGCAGVIVSMRLQRSGNPSAALGSNLLGSVLGGCLEYLSLAVGLRALVLVAFALYLGALLAGARERSVLRPGPSAA
jgi:hypothetical protein